MNSRLVQVPSVLLVDDNPDDNYIHTRRIQDMGLVETGDAIFVKTNGMEALRFLENYDANREALGERFPPRLVLLDINMPVMNGFEFLSRFTELSRTGRYDDVNVAILTSSDHRRDKERAARFACVKAYLIKPPDIDNLRALLERLA